MSYGLSLLNISKKQSLILSQERADHAANDKYFLQSIIRCDKPWVYDYDPKNTSQVISVEYSHVTFTEGSGTEVLRCNTMLHTFLKSKSVIHYVLSYKGHLK
jgi:hypothetical protein